MNENEQQRMLELMARDIFNQDAQTKPKSGIPAAAQAASTFFTVAATWFICILLLMPFVWLIWTIGKWMF